MIFINRLFERIARKGRIGILDIFPIIYIIIINIVLAKILQLILVISTKYRLVLCARNARFPRAISNYVPWYGVFVVIFFSTILIRFGFCEIRYNQGLGKCYKTLASADKTYLDLDYSIKKNASNNC